MRQYLLALTIATTLSATVSASDAADPALKGLRDRWNETIKSLNIPGLAVVAVRGDEVILLESLGVRDPNGAKPVTPDTYFYIASCTKPYTAAVVAQLASAGKLDLDAPVKQYLPRFELSDADATAKLTVRDLLAHRPGLNAFPIVFLDAFTGEITNDRYYHFLKAVKPRGQVGYSNIHFTLAGRVIEAIEGKGWREALDDRLFAPAKMTRTTGYASRMYNDADVAIPLQQQANGWQPTEIRKTDRTMHAAGGLGTTARDLARWLRLNLNGGRVDGVQILSAATVSQMYTLHSESKGNHAHPDFKVEGFGLGWQVGSYRGHRLVSHGGGYAGTAAHISFMPEHKIGVAVLANTDGAAGALVELAAIDVYDRLLGPPFTDMMPKLHERAERNRNARRGAPATPSNPVQAPGLSLPVATYAGIYENEHWGTLKIELKDGALTASMGDLPVRLRSNGPDRFQVAIDPQTWRDAHFDVMDGNVAAAILVWNDYGEVRFQRK